MGKIIRAYTDIDSIFDTKRGIIQNRIEEMEELDKLPLIDRIKRCDEIFRDVFSKKYMVRKYHLFNNPTFEITPEWFKEAYEKRNVDYFTYFYPTPCLKGMLSVIVRIEDNKVTPFDVDGVICDVNTWPYEFDDEQKEELLENLKLLGGNKINFKLINTNVNEATAGEFRNYSYVFKSDIMFGYKKFHESLETTRIPDTVFVIPEINYTRQDGFTQNPEVFLSLLSLTTSPTIGLFPIDKSFYDCYE